MINLYKHEIIKLLFRLNPRTLEFTFCMNFKQKEEYDFFSTIAFQMYDFNKIVTFVKML